MKKAVCGLLLVSLLAACNYATIRTGDSGDRVEGSGNRKTERREVAGFDRLLVEGAYRVEVASGSPPSLEVEADDNLLPLIRAEVEGGRLRVHNERGMSTKEMPRLRLTVPDLREVELPGASEFSLTGVKNESLKISVPGASKLRAEGETGRLEVALSGAGLIDAEGLRARQVKASCSGAGSISVHASETLDASVSGVGSINYSGNPATVNRSVSGLGKINPK
jgi:Putative auto-transporter adhesin, head GIN domain